MNLPTSQLHPFSFVITLCIISRAIHRSIGAVFVCPKENFRHHIEYEINLKDKTERKKKKNHNFETKIKGTNN